MLTIRAMTGGNGYAQRHLQQSDYFDQQRTVEGRWHGRGAELLGLSGKVTSADFESVRQGLDPATGEFVRQRHKFAGLCDRWIDPHGKEIESCTIITTTPNSHLTDIHDRMPVILPSGAHASWLNPSMKDPAVALGWLAPFAGAMRRDPVSARVNQVENDDAECAEPIEVEAPPQGQLFG